MNPKLFLMIGFLTIAIVFIAAAVAIPKGILLDLVKLLLLAIGMVAVILAFSSRYYFYLLLPMIQQRTKHIILSEQPPYWLATSGDAIVTKIGADFIATTYINIPIYVSGSEMSNEERLRLAEQISKLVGVNKDPVRFSTELRIMDKEGYLKIIKEEIALAEEEAVEVQSGTNESAKERVRGKLAMWKKVLDHIGSKTSMELVTFASVSAIGSKEYEAIALAQQKAKDLMNGIGAILGVVPNIIVGVEILKLVEPEYLIPLSTVSEEITKRIEHGEVE